jgi:hypothetical protein
MDTNMWYTEVVPTVMKTTAGQIDWNRVKTSAGWGEQRLRCQSTRGWKRDAEEFFTDAMKHLKDYMEDEEVKKVHTQLEARLLLVKSKWS